MSFNKIKNPKKREDEVKKYLALKNELRLRDRTEKMGEFGREETLNKIFKPVTGATSKLEESLTKQIKELPGNIVQALPPPPPLPMIGPEPIPGPVPPVEDEPLEGAVGGEPKKKKFLIPGEPELSQYLIDLKSNNKVKDILNVEVFADGTYNIELNEKPFKIEKIFITYENQKYKKTPGLLELLFSEKTKNLDNYSIDDISNYREIINNSKILEKNLKLQKSITPNKKFIQNKFFKKKWNILRPYWSNIIKPKLKEKKTRRTTKKRTRRTTRKTRKTSRSDTKNNR